MMVDVVHIVLLSDIILNVWVCVCVFCASAWIYMYIVYVPMYDK